VPALKKRNMTENLNEEVYQPCGRVVVRKIGSDTLLVPVSGPASGGRVFPVNDSAMVVWDCLTEGGTVREASEALIACYSLDPAVALEDSKACIDTFLSEGLLEKKEA